MEEHDVRRPKAALRLGLQDVVPRASQALQGLQDGLQGLQDGAALAALRLLRGPPATCRLTLRQDDGEAFGAEWRVDGQGAEDSLLQTLVVALAASGRLLQVGFTDRMHALSCALVADAQLDVLPTLAASS